ncbi:MAG TPA: tetratricopeptide repeat protein [Hanamia sp.]|nr:tetratricopeptide repeat protein [Hanamia sp.]
MKSLLLTLTACFIVLISFSQNPDSAQFYYQKGMVNNNGKLYAIAAKDFDKAILFNPNFTEAYIENGKVNLTMFRFGAATENYEKAYQLDPKNNDVIDALSTLYFNNRQFQKAIDLAQKCNNCDNTNRILGMSNYYLEDYAKAEKYLKLSLSKNDKDAQATYTLGLTYLELENEKSAIEEYQKAITLEPAQSLWIYELGLICYNQNDYKSALKYFDMAVEKGYNKTNDYYENYGFAQLYTGDTENGIKTLNMVLERKPNNKELLNNMAHAMYDTKKYNEALDYFKKLLDINPKDAPSLFMAGLTLQKLGQKDKGQKICDNAIAMDPSLARYRQKKEMPAGL